MTRGLLVATHNYPRFPGDPAGAFVARLAHAARDAGWAVSVLAPWSADLPLHERVDGLDLHRFRPGRASGRAITYRGDLHTSAFRSLRTAAALPGFLWEFRAAFRRLHARLQPAVVHAHWWVPAGLVATSVANTPTVITCHGSDVRLLERSRLARMLGRRVARRAAVMTTVSAFLARDLEAHLPRQRADIRTLYMPVDDALYSTGLGTPRVHPPRLLYAGNLLESKGVDVLLRAVQLLRERGVACTLRILGEGPDLRRLQTLAATLGLDDVEWQAFLPQDRMPAEYGAATVTVLPTRGNAEGLGLTLVEAQLAGCAVVGTRAGGIPEVITDEVSGLLVDADDPDALATACARLMTDEALRQRLVTDARISALQRFGQREASARYLELYEALCAH